MSAQAGGPEKASLQEGRRPEDKEERGEAQACSTLGKGPRGTRGSRGVSRAAGSEGMFSPRELRRPYRKTGSSEGSPSQQGAEWLQKTHQRTAPEVQLWGLMRPGLGS